MKKWHIVDWSGNVCFNADNLLSWEAGEEILMEQLGKNYDEERGYYYVLPQN